MPRKAGAGVVRCLVFVVFLLVGRVFRHASTLPRGCGVGNALGKGEQGEWAGMLDWWNLMCSDAHVPLHLGDRAFFM
jgi:hypothetical protein